MDSADQNADIHATAGLAYALGNSMLPAGLVHVPGRGSTLSYPPSPPSAARDFHRKLEGLAGKGKSSPQWQIIFVSGRISYTYVVCEHIGPVPTDHIPK
jgi:hypothetical protein